MLFSTRQCRCPALLDAERTGTRPFLAKVTAHGNRQGAVLMQHVICHVLEFPPPIGRGVRPGS